MFCQYCCLLSQREEVAGKEAYLVQREAWVAWDGEVGVERDVLDFLLCFPR